VRAARTADGEVLPVRVEGIPQELERRPQWVVWRRERRGKEWTKVLYDPRTGRKASSTDLLSWSPVEVAYKQGGYDGVGFVFCSGDPYVGVDLDGCRDPNTGKIESWAVEVIRSLGGYAEVSPSGAGVHVIVRGKAPNRRRGPLEVYSTERYFTVTGRAL
jgi:primase-polymerase (primpol)-like protein